MRLSVPAGLLALAGLTVPQFASAVVLHPDAAAIPVGSRPLDSVMAIWGGGSAVAVAPNWFISSRHQGGSVASNVTFDGVSYDVVEQVPLWDPERPSYPLPADETDLVLWRIDGSLNDWTPVVSSHASPGTAVTIGGFGRTRNGTATTDGAGTGYNVSATGGVLTWGTNAIDDDYLAGLDLNNDSVTDARGWIYEGDFDGPGLNTEATIALGDSGGGWFVNEGGVWKLIGLTHGVDHPNRAIYDAPEKLYAIAIPEYVGDINAVVPEPATVMLLAAGVGAMVGWRREKRR